MARQVVLPFFMNKKTDNMDLNANYWIEKLQLQKHPEGGYYRETYRATETIPLQSLPKRFSGERCYCTGIYFLLTDKEFSAFHRIQADEMWHFYKGNSVEIYVLQADGELKTIKLGNQVEQGEQLQAVIPAGQWFASKVTSEDGYALVGCTVAPGFAFDDFELANRQILAQEYPQYQELIAGLTRQN
jgi:uncharacterized protein